MRSDHLARRPGVWLSLVAGILAVGLTAVLLAGREAARPDRSSADGIDAFLPAGPDPGVVEYVRGVLGAGLELREVGLGVDLLPRLVTGMPMPDPDLLDEAGYRVEQVVDDVSALVPVQARGWGTVLHRTGGTRVHVQVPHPWSDLGTAGLGAEVFEAAAAGHLTLAGARRSVEDGGADASHNGDLPFEAVHVALLDLVDLVVQVHGFASAPRPQLDAEVVVSAGPGDQGLVATLADDLRAAGLRVCVPGQGPCDDLAGRTNQQGATALAAGVDFLHLEVADTVRGDDQRRALLVEVVAAWIGARG